MEQNLTRKKPLGLIFKFTLPLLIINLIEQFCYILDSIFVGAFAGPTALAGFGIASIVEYIVFNFAYNACVGFCIVIAQKFGARNKKGVRFSVATAFYLYFAFTITLTIAGIAITKPLLWLMDTPQNVFKSAQDYSVVLFLGSFSQIGFILLNEMLKSVGENKTPLLILIFNSILNVIFSFFFIGLFKMQNKGAALSAVVSKTISCIFCLIFIYKKYKFMWPKNKEWHLKKRYVFSEIKIGLPLAFEFLFTGLATIVLQKTVDNFGENIIAGFTIAIQFEDLIITAIAALTTATSTFTAQNFGARKFKRIVKGAKISFLIGMGFCLAFALLVFLFWSQVTDLFLSSNTSNPASREIIKNATKKYLDIAILNYPILCVLLVFKAFIEALGKPLLAFLSCVFYVITQFVTCYILPKMSGYTGVCFSAVAPWYAGAIFITIAFFYNIRKLKEIKPL